MPDTGHNDERAIRHGRSHCPEIGGRNPAVALAPQHKMRMMDLRHAALQPAVGEAPAGVGATGSADTTAPRIMRSIASGELVSIVPLVTKSTTSTGYSTGLSVWMKCPVSGEIFNIGRLPAFVMRVINGE